MWILGIAGNQNAEAKGETGNKPASTPFLGITQLFLYDGCAVWTFVVAVDFAQFVRLCCSKVVSASKRGVNRVAAFWTWKPRVGAGLPHSPAWHWNYSLTSSNSMDSQKGQHGFSTIILVSPMGTTLIGLHGLLSKEILARTGKVLPHSGFLHFHISVFSFFWAS